MARLSWAWVVTRILFTVGWVALAVYLVFHVKH